MKIKADTTCRHNSRRPKYHFTTAQELMSFKICFIAMHLNCFFYELQLTYILKITYFLTASLGLAYVKLSQHLSSTFLTYKLRQPTILLSLQYDKKCQLDYHMGLRHWYLGYTLKMQLNTTVVVGLQILRPTISNQDFLTVFLNIPGNERLKLSRRIS